MTHNSMVEYLFFGSLRTGEGIDLFRWDEVIAPDARDLQTVLLKGLEMRTPADVCHRTADLLQKSSQNAAKGACAIDEITGILALVHRTRF